jgi:hypothetical protein
MNDGEGMNHAQAILGAVAVARGAGPELACRLSKGGEAMATKGKAKKRQEGDAGNGNLS